MVAPKSTKKAAPEETASKTPKSDKKPATKRYRNFGTIVYPESAPENWRDTLSDTRIPAFISPLHDKDTNPGGETKKPHYHILLLYDAPHTKEQAAAVFDTIKGVGCEIVQSVRGNARYLCHLDNPEKAQYLTENVTALNGADYLKVIGLASDKYKAIGEMIDWCIETDCVMYWQLLQYARANRYDWFRVLCDNGTMVMMNFLKSRQFQLDKEREENGEVLSVMEHTLKRGGFKA